MGFTIASYNLYGLPPLPNIYVSIHGSYSVKKAPAVTPICIEGLYNISFTLYFSASKDDPVITQKEMSFNIQALPNPAVLYKIIYDYIKGQLAQSAGSVGADPYYLSNQQLRSDGAGTATERVETLTFTDD